MFRVSKAGPSDRLLAEAFFKFKGRAGSGMCWVQGCSNARKGDRSLCNKHNMQRWRSKKKTASAYHTLKHHAKGRRVKFDITPDYFRGLVDAFGMFSNPPEGEILTIDRVNAALGYVERNLRVVSLSVNVIKGNKERYLPEAVQEYLERERRTLRETLAAHLCDDEEENPF